MIDLSDPNVRMEVIKALYLEKKRKDHPGLMDFSFTPGPKWMDVPAIDLANTLLDMFKNPETVVESVCPHSGKKKKVLTHPLL